MRGDKKFIHNIHAVHSFPTLFSKTSMIRSPSVQQSRNTETGTLVTAILSVEPMTSATQAPEEKISSDFGHPSTPLLKFNNNRAKLSAHHEKTFVAFKDIPDSLTITVENDLTPRDKYDEATLTPESCDTGKASYVNVNDQTIYKSIQGDGIILQPLLEPYSKNIPMDGIVFRHNFKTAVTIGDRTSLVKYDAALGAWRKYNGWNDQLKNPVWLISTSPAKWETGSVDQYKKIATTLPVAVEIKAVEMPRIPKLPDNIQPIPKTIHYVWVGDEALPEKMVENIKKNRSNSHGFQSIIHVDAIQKNVLTEIQKQFEGSGITISDLNDEKFFKNFLPTENSGLYTHAKKVKRYVNSADYMRWRLINEYGGIYMDVDDAFKQSIENIDIFAAHGDVLLGPVVVNYNVGFEGYNSSIFASLANNPVVIKILEKMTNIYNADRSFYDKARPVLIRNALGNVIVGSEEEMRVYARQVFERTGPGMCNDVLKKYRPDYYDLFDRYQYSGLSVHIVNCPYDNKMREVLDHYLPFFEKVPVEIGHANSWEVN
ncbi:glycosyltransferase family 32 protein [Glaciimonas immobilis]|uniref:Glycosyltransferase sugar-binding region containing DXD motif-containing protein n=1 Tax=Glaciimonas immobilis TaxID=728004 RepID=A0A840S0Y7_9BURK|nr:glycosyltransferase [Glaciimonas immobilis]KAF3997207.1 hypothetical protein HAV38_16255 [Glaciimonas immobilis]MBB5202249.1 hypothetical protein [Glaciimonas immobilis]